MFVQAKHVEEPAKQLFFGRSHNVCHHLLEPASYEVLRIILQNATHILRTKYMFRNIHKGFESVHTYGKVIFIIKLPTAGGKTNREPDVLLLIQLEENISGFGKGSINTRTSYLITSSKNFLSADHQGEVASCARCLSYC